MAILTNFSFIVLTGGSGAAVVATTVMGTIAGMGAGSNTMGAAGDSGAGAGATGAATTRAPFGFSGEPMSTKGVISVSSLNSTGAGAGGGGGAVVAGAAVGCSISLTGEAAGGCSSTTGSSATSGAAGTLLPNAVNCESSP